MSPEFFKNSFYDQKIDIWSLGLIMYFLLENKLPWNMDE